MVQDINFQVVAWYLQKVADKTGGSWIFPDTPELNLVQELMKVPMPDNKRFFDVLATNDFSDIQSTLAALGYQTPKQLQGAELHTAYSFWPHFQHGCELSLYVKDYRYVYAHLKSDFEVEICLDPRQVQPLNEDLPYWIRYNMGPYTFHVIPPLLGQDATELEIYTASRGAISNWPSQEVPGYSGVGLPRWKYEGSHTAPWLQRVELLRTGKENLRATVPESKIRAVYTSGGFSIKEYFYMGLPVTGTSMNQCPDDIYPVLDNRWWIITHKDVPDKPIRIFNLSSLDYIMHIGRVDLDIPTREQLALAFD